MDILKPYGIDAAGNAIPIASVVQGGSCLESGLQMELLWENASPSSEFAAQTIEVDLSPYDMVAVSFYRYTTVPRENTAIIKVGENGSLNDSLTNTDKAPTISMRAFQTSATGVVFTVATYQDANQTTRTENNSFDIPTRIYGINGVRMVIE